MYCLHSRVHHPTNGRVLTMFTDQPGVQFYTGNGLDGSPGKGGVCYHQYGAFCLEAQNYPDAINQVSLLNTVNSLKNGQTLGLRPQNQMLEPFSTP